VASRYLLDTNTVSFHIRQSSAALRRRLRRVDASRVALSVVTEMELLYGLARTPKLKIAPLVEEFLAGMTVLPLDSDVAATYARVRADLESRGRPIGPLDLMIGAHALSTDATLITNNVKEFRWVRGLKAQDWTR
jgi:tRNA(fMet)-specific endonuclease VapC